MKRHKTCYFSFCFPMLGSLSDGASLELPKLTGKLLCSEVLCGIWPINSPREIPISPVKDSYASKDTFA